MTDEQKEKVKKAVLTFTQLANINEPEKCKELIGRLYSMKESDVIDYLVVTISDLKDKGRLSKEDILSNVELLTSISKAYPSVDKLVARLQWLKEMNITHPEMSLTDNHALVMETFDKFNELIGTKFDSFYTGGLMGYIATDHRLERYHGDLDLFINEEQLPALCELVRQSEDFSFVCNMEDKEQTGHEFAINYKGKPMNIGLFLFARTPDNGVVIKSYYHKDNDPSKDLLVNETQLDPEYSKLVFTNNVKTHNNIPYRMQSLEAIYNSKKGGRPKDQYDANIIKGKIDVMIDYKIDVNKRNNKKVIGKNANNSIVAQMEQAFYELDEDENIVL